VLRIAWSRWLRGVALVEQVGEGWDVPAETRDHVRFHWFHVAPASSLVVVVLSHRPLWFVGHFVKGRMLKCSGEVCAWCAAGVGRQVRYVVSVAELHTRRVGVIELSESIAQLLKEWSCANGGSHGLMVELRKAGRSKHCRMDLTQIREPCPLWAQGMDGLDLREVLLRTWDRVESEMGASLLNDVSPVRTSSRA